MKIIVVGIGKIGETVLESLVSEGHDVTAIDADPAVIRDITNLYDAICICGNATDVKTLKEADAEHADMFVSATSSDEFNMLACFLAGRLGAGHTVARIRTPEYTEKNLRDLRQMLDISLSINPELTAAEEMYRIIKLPQAAKVETFSRKNLEVIELYLKEDSRLIGLPLKDLRRKVDAKVLVCAVQREKEVFIPGGDFVLHAGDRVGLIAPPDQFAVLFRAFGSKKHAKKVMLLGATRTSYYLAKKLLSDGTAVTIIDQDAERCKSFSELLPEAVMVQGNTTEQEVLREEGIDGVNALAALTGTDEENILTSFFATTLGVGKVLTKVNRKELVELAEKLGLEGIVSPRQSISDVITRYARALHNSIGSNMETLYKLMDGAVEALEFIVRDDFKWLNTPIKELPLLPDTLIVGITRGRKTILPGGDDCILPGDRVVVVAKGKRVENLTDIFE